MASYKVISQCACCWNDKGVKKYRVTKNNGSKKRESFWSSDEMFSYIADKEKPKDANMAFLPHIPFTFCPFCLEA